MSDQQSNERENQNLERRRSPRSTHGDPVSNTAWAAILIWAGLVFLARNMGWLVALPGDMGIWSVVFIGAGFIILLEALIRLLVFRHQQVVMGSLFLAVIFTGIGFGSIFGWDIVWPFILIAVGLSILVKNVWN